MKQATDGTREYQAEPRVASIDYQMTAEVAQGVLSSTGVGSFNLQNLLLCIYEADQAALILESGVDEIEQAIKDKDIKEAIGGVVAAVGFVKQL